MIGNQAGPVGAGKLREDKAMFKLTLSLDGAAFEDDRATEIARILRAVAGTIEGLVRHDALGTYSSGIRDINGNTVGKWSCFPNGDVS